MSRKLSLLVLVSVVAAIGVMFFQVVQPFVFALLVAAVLALLFRPAFLWAKRLCRDHDRIAAGISTVVIIVLILVPLGGALVLAGVQLFELGADITAWVESPEESELSQRIDRIRQSRLIQWIKQRYESLPEDQQSQVRSALGNAASSVSREIYGKTQDFITDVVGFAIGFVVMSLALYYFFADGPKLLEETKRLSPLEDEDVQALFEQFEKVCRGVILGTVVSALAQAVLAGIGFAVAGVPNVLLLMAVTMFFSFIPFLGAGSVCFSVVAYLVFQERYLAAGGLFIYSLAIVTTSDNLIKAHVIGGESKLNPLVVLITVLGALQMIGLWGIFVGPMIAAFFYALLKILRRRLIDEEETANARAAGDNRTVAANSTN